MKTESKRKIVAGSLTAVIFASLSGLLWMHDTNGNLTKDLNEEKLKSESLLSEKLSLDKQIQQMKDQIASLMGKNGDLDKILKETSGKLSRKEKELANINWDKNKSAKLEKELAQLKNDFDKQLMSYNTTIADLKRENEELQATVLSMTGHNEQLKSDNDLLKAIVTTNFRVDATKGKKDKLTVVAKRTNRLTMGFDMPEDVVENVHFKIESPNGKIYESEIDGITMRAIEDDNNLLASIGGYNGEFNVNKRIEMTFQPKDRLSRGIYQIQIFNGESYIGSCQVKLR